MLTDNWPVDFRYISRRIVKEIVQQHEAARSQGAFKTSLTGSLGVGPGASVELSRRPIDYTNYFDLARRATAAVSDNTGWLDRYEPARIPTGPYVRVKMHLQEQKVPLIVWEEANNHPIAAFAGTETLPGVGRVFVGLVGSASNFMHVLAGPSKATRTPSDAFGLYDIIQQCRELTEDGILEPGVSAHQLAYERRRFADDDARFVAAAELFTGCGLSEPSTLLEVLIQVHHSGADVDLGIHGPDGRGMGAFDLVILGAPVWVSTLEPQRDEAVLPSGHHRYQLPDASDAAIWSLKLRPVAGHDPLDPSPHPLFGGPGPTLQHDVKSLVLHQAPALRRTPNWAVFDAQLDAYLAAVSQARVPWPPPPSVIIDQWPPGGVLWREFGEWFVDVACRLGSDPLPFVVPSRRFRLAGLRFGWSDRSELSGKYGWFVPGNRKSFVRPRGCDSQGVIVLMDGTVWAAHDNGFYRGTGKPRLVACDGPAMEAAAAGMFRTVAQWRTPMTHADQVPAIEITPNEPVARRDGDEPG